MIDEHLKQLRQAFFESNIKTFFSSKLTGNQERLCEELDNAIWSSTIGKPYVDSFDYSGIRNLERFLTENQNDQDLKFVLNLKRGKSTSTALHDVANWNAEAVDLFLKAGTNPNIKDGNGKSAIEHVTDSAYEDWTNIKHYVYIIKLLVKNGADPNVRGKNGKSAIECVIDSSYEDDADIYSYPDIIEHLIKAGADLNAQQCQAALELVIFATDYFNKEECIKIATLLVNAGADINLRDECSGRTLLHRAAANGQENIVELLLQSTKGKKRTQLIDAQDDNGNTPLHCAVENSGYSNIVELLLAHGADYKIVNKKCKLSGIKGEDTPLHVASQKSDMRNIEPFFSKELDLDIDAKNGDGATPLLIASRFGSAKIVQSFLENGANAHAKDKHGNTALHYAANHEYTNDQEGCNQLFDESNKNHPEDDNEIEDNEKIIQSLINEGVKVNDQNKYGHTPLFFAVEHGKYSNTQLLLKNGTNVNIADENGFTVFHFVVRQKDLNLLKILLPKKAINGNKYVSPANDENDNPIKEIDVENAKRALNVIDKEGNTLLHHAIKWGCDEEILNLLEEYGVNVNQKNNYGIAPIHIAAKYGDSSQINFLINKGADLNLQCDIISRSVIDNIGREKELSDDSTDTYIDVQDSTVNVNNTEHKKVTPLAIVTQDSSRSNITTFLSAGAKPSIEDSRNCLPLHIAIKRVSEKGCTEKERDERLEIVRILAFVSDVKFLMSEGVNKKSEIWKNQLFERTKNSLKSALGVANNDKVQRKILDAFRDVMLQVTCDEAEIKKILQDAIESKNSEKSPTAPMSEEASDSVLDDDFYNEIGSHVKEPTLYPNLSKCLASSDYRVDECDLQGDHSKLQRQWRVTAEQIADTWSQMYGYIEKENAKIFDIEESALGKAGNIPGTSGVGSWDSTSQNSINLWMNLQESTSHKQIHNNKDKPSEKPNEIRKYSFKLNLNQKTQLNEFLDLVSKTTNMTELYDVVNKALKAGVMINYARGNKDTFTNEVIFRTDYFNYGKEDDKIAGKMICALASKGGYISDEICMWNLGKASDVYKEDLQKAKQEFDQYCNQFKKIAKSAINHGELSNLEIDNTTFYLGYSEDSIVDVAKVIDGRESLGASGGGVIKIGENAVEIEISDGVKNYTNLSGNGCVILTLKGLEIALYHDVHNKDRVIVEVSDNDRKRLDGLSDEEKKKAWGSYRLGGSLVYDAITRGYFEKSCLSRLQASEIINPSVQSGVGEIIRNLNTNDITLDSPVNSSVNGVQLSKVTPEQRRGRMHG